MYKSKNNLSPQIGQGIFQIRNTHPNMRTQHDFVLPGPKTVNYFKGRNFRGRNFREWKNSRNFWKKLSPNFAN